MNHYRIQIDGFEEISVLGKDEDEALRNARDYWAIWGWDMEREREVFVFKKVEDEIYEANV